MHHTLQLCPETNGGLLSGSYDSDQRNWDSLSKPSCLLLKKHGKQTMCHLILHLIYQAKQITHYWLVEGLAGVWIQHCLDGDRISTAKWFTLQRSGACGDWILACVAQMKSITFVLHEGRWEYREGRERRVNLMERDRRQLQFTTAFIHSLIRLLAVWSCYCCDGESTTILCSYLYPLTSLRTKTHTFSITRFLTRTWKGCTVLCFTLPFYCVTCPVHSLPVLSSSRCADY